MSFETQSELESQYLMRTYGRKPVCLVSGQGMTVRDDAGREYLDFVSGVGADSLGHCHPAVVEAVKSQAETLIHVSNYYYIENRGEVAKALSDLLNDAVEERDREPWKVFFANSGAEANECAIKLARLHARRKAESAGRGADPARLIVTLDRSFHGRTLATLAATAQPVKQEVFQPLPAGFVSTPINDIPALEALFEQQGEQICAVMIECIQGESGVHPCEPEFLAALRRLTIEHDALLVCDEVQCGIFRAGFPFAFQLFGVVPDVVTIAKGVASGFPTGMCAAREDVAAAYQPGDHGSTFGGSCLAAAAAKATLATLVDQDFGAHVREVGSYMRDKLARLPRVAEVRGYGLMNAVDLDGEAPNAPDVVSKGLEAGLLLNATGPHTLRFLPPLICEKEDVDVLVERLGGILGV